jgi:hypothetical protein
MSFTGHIIDGKVVLPSPLPLPNGTKVTVEEVTETSTSISPASSASRLDHYRDVIGQVELPADAATQHDHYLYGTPKR